jgi:hypothetical protein
METMPEDDWYRTQGEYSGENQTCGQACVAMVIEKVTTESPSVADIVDHIGVPADEKTDWNDLKIGLEKWGVDYVPITSTTQVSQAIRDRDHPAIAVVAMNAIGEGPDCNDPDAGLEQHCHKYVTYDGGHWMIPHTISGDGTWVIAYDPYVFARDVYWYLGDLEGVPKGWNRHYLYSEFGDAFEALHNPALEIIGPDWYRYQGEESVGGERAENNYCGQTCVAMAIQYVTEWNVGIDELVREAGAGSEEVLTNRALSEALDNWDMTYEPIRDMSALREAVHERRNIAIAKIDMSEISAGNDFEDANTDPRDRHGKYAEPSGEAQAEHWVVVKGITADDGRRVIVHDPYVFDEDIYRYAGDMWKGRNRYYAEDEFEDALVDGSAVEITGSSRPRLAVTLHEQSTLLILRPGEVGEVFITVQNTGWDTWEAGHYSLVNINGVPLGAPLQEMAQDVDVPLGATVSWVFPVTAPAEGGLHDSEWQLSHNGQLLGDSYTIDVLVATADVFDPATLPELWQVLKEQTGEWLEIGQEELLRQAEEWLESQEDELRRRILEVIEAEKERLWEGIVDALCGGPAATIAGFLAVAWLGRRRRNPGKKEG